MSYFRLMTQLPAQPLTPGKPPLPLEDVIAAMQEELEPAHWGMASAMLRWLDVRNLESLLSGREGLFDGRALLDREALSLRSAAELPDFIEDILQRHDGGTLPASSLHAQLWRAYYETLVALADDDEGFLGAWVAWEVPLLNTLARWRAEQIGVDADEDLIEEPSGPAPHDELLARVAEEPEPLARERIIDEARLVAIESFSGTDPFSIDAVLAYLASALILDRWDLPKEANAEQLLEVFE